MFSKLSKLFNNLNKTERCIFGGAAVILIVSLFFFLAQKFYDIAVEAPANGGHYTEGVIGQPTTLNPLLTGGNEADRDLTELLFANLADLVEKITPSEDHKTWDVVLKEAVRWSDGETLTTADIVFTIEMIQNPDTQSPLFTTWNGIVTERLSDKEVRLSVRNPYGFFQDNLNSLKIVPKHIFANIPPSNLRLSNFNLEPVGSGPYAFISSEKNKDGFVTKYHLKANEFYGKNKPYVEFFTFKFFKNQKEALDGFNRKEIDGLGAIDPKKFDELKISHQSYSLNTPRYYAIFLNQSAHPALKDKAVRNGLAQSVNRSQIISSVFNNHAMLVNGPILSIIDGYDPNVYKESGADLEAIKKSLDKAGWKVNEKTGYRMEFNLAVPQIQFLIDAAELIKKDWEQIEIKLDYTVSDVSGINETIKIRNYQMILFGNILRGNPDTFSFWHSSERFYPGLNLSVYNNKKVDDILESIRKELDAESRKKKLSQLQEIFYSDNPAIFLFSPNYIYAVPKNLGGFKMKILVLPSDRFKNVNEWYLKTARVLKLR